MNIFLTGATGGLGRALLTPLTAHGHRITALARNPTMLPELPGLDVVGGDLLEPDTFRNALTGCQAVLHLAALTHAVHAKDYGRVNVDGTWALLGACRDVCPQARFVFVGTRAMGAACGAYGASKARAEALVRASGLAHWVILRPAEIYGVGRGEAIADLARRCAKGGLVPLPGDGGQMLAPVHVDDVITAILTALTSPAALSHTYVLAGPEEISFAALADRLAARAGKRILKISVPLFFFTIAAAVLSCLMKRPPLVPDQIARLTGTKDADIRAARADLDFAPRPLEAGMADI